MAGSPANLPVTDEIDIEALRFSLRRPRSLFSYVMSLLTGAATIAALLPLFSVLYLLLKKGLEAMSIATLIELPPAAMAPGGGIGNAIVGTVVIVLLATLISVPI